MGVYPWQVAIWEWIHFGKVFESGREKDSVFFLFCFFCCLFVCLLLKIGKRGRRMEGEEFLLSRLLFLFCQVVCYSRECQDRGGKYRMLS